MIFGLAQAWIKKPMIFGSNLPLLKFRFVIVVISRKNSRNNKIKIDAQHLRAIFFDKNINEIPKSKIHWKINSSIENKSQTTFIFHKIVLKWIFDYDFLNVERQKKAEIPSNCFGQQAIFKTFQLARIGASVILSNFLVA